MIAINVMAFAAFGMDKMLSRRGRVRIPESTLLQLAFFGGSAGAYAGRQLFSHKTSKQPFSDWLHGIATLQSIALIGLAIWYTFWGR